MSTHLPQQVAGQICDLLSASGIRVDADQRAGIELMLARWREQMQETSAQLCFDAAGQELEIAELKEGKRRWEALATKRAELLQRAEQERNEARAEMIRAIARCNTANAEAAQLRTDLAELKQDCRRSEAAEKAAWDDSARLDWLEQSEESCMCWNVDGSKNNGWTVGDISEGTETNGATLRTAIDAARAKGGAS